MDLRPPLLDEVGLVPALRAYVEAQAGLSGVTINLTAVGLADRLPPEVEMTCYRVVQEAITNVLRHAEARTAVVYIEQRPTDIAIAIKDNGRGFVVGEAGAGAGAHLGLVGMRERARALGGSFSLTSQPGAGTSIFLCLPVTGPAAT